MYLFKVGGCITVFIMRVNHDLEDSHKYYERFNCLNLHCTRFPSHLKNDV